MTLKRTESGIRLTTSYLDDDFSPQSTGNFTAKPRRSYAPKKGLRRTTAHSPQFCGEACLECFKAIWSCPLYCDLHESVPGPSGGSFSRALVAKQLSKKQDKIPSNSSMRHDAMQPSLPSQAHSILDHMTYDNEKKHEKTVQICQIPAKSNKSSGEIAKSKWRRDGVLAKTALNFVRHRKIHLYV